MDPENRTAAVFGSRKAGSEGDIGKAADDALRQIQRGDMAVTSAVTESS